MLGGEADAFKVEAVRLLHEMRSVPAEPVD